jgi:hypothetical protein
MSEPLELKPDDRFLRWLHPGQFDWNENRATSAAFKDPQMSVDILSKQWMRAINERKTR